MNRIKRNIAVFKALSLGDRLNVSLFVLTVVSLIVAVVSLVAAGWGVHVAIVTLNEARQGGKEQQAALNASKDALIATTGILNGQMAIQGNTLKAANQANSLLQATTKAAGNEVELLKNISEQPDRRGILTASLSCEDEKEKVQRSPELIGETERHRLRIKDAGASAFKLTFVDEVEYACELKVKNIGNANLENFELVMFYDAQRPDLYGWDGFGARSWKQLSSEEWGPGFVISPAFGGVLLTRLQNEVGQSRSFRLRMSRPLNGYPFVRDWSDVLTLRMEPANVPFDYVRIPIVRLPAHSSPVSAHR